MFAKLGQRSTSWWICVMITGVFAASLLTVVAYPAYAALCTATCTESSCGGNGPPHYCSTCNTGLNEGYFTHKAQVNTFSIWASSNSNDCFGQVGTNHSVEATNFSNAQRQLRFTYKSLVLIHSGDVTRCDATDASLPDGEWDGSLTIPAGQTRSHSRSQTVTWKLGAQGVACTYKGQAVTQVRYVNFGNADVQCPGPQTALANCN